jgi:CrcB protein
MILLKTIAALSLGASFGATLRFLFEKYLNSVFSNIHLGTLSANLLGGFLIGIAFSFFAKNPDIAPEWRIFVITGFLGGLTTFSSFSVETTVLLQQGHYSSALLVIGLHVVGSLILTACGFALFSLLKM